MLVEVCDVHTLIGADSLGADAVTHNILLEMNNTKGSIAFPLPVDSIVVHLHKWSKFNHLFLNHFLGLPNHKSEELTYLGEQEGSIVLQEDLPAADGSD